MAMSEDDEEGFMKKKVLKKLVLDKETVRRMGEADLRGIAGAHTLEDCPSSPVNPCQHETNPFG